MIRLKLIALLSFTTMAVAITSLAIAQAQESERQRKVRVALTLAAVGEVCGPCQTNLDDCRVEAKLKGKPLVLFVGVESRGRGELLCPDAIACLVSEYPHDGKPAKDPRVIVLQPGEEMGEKHLYIRATLPATATVEQIREQLAPAKTRPVGAKLDWNL